MLKILYFHTNTHTETFAHCATYHMRHWWHRLAEMEQQVYQVHDIYELKQRLIDVWHVFWAKCHQHVKVWNFEHLIQLHIMHILFCLSYLLILWTLNKSYCVTCSRILPLSVFCVLRGSGVTPLKCGEIYDMNFVANFMDNMTVKKFWKLVNMFHAYERMCSGTVFIEIRCNASAWLLTDITELFPLWWFIVKTVKRYVLVYCV